eukprot:6931715-Pyramimonas_sp.AAC.1
MQLMWRGLLFLGVAVHGAGEAHIPGANLCRQLLPHGTMVTGTPPAGTRSSVWSHAWPAAAARTPGAPSA